MANYRNTYIRDQYSFDDENNPVTSYYDIIRPRTTLDAVFDDTDPYQKTLREIINGMKVDISTGGGIVFPVTSVNGKSGGDITIYPRDIGLENVDNTADADKPLSIPQALQVDAKIANAINDMGSITFPVTKVNGNTGDVVITIDSLDTSNAVTNKITAGATSVVNNHNNNQTAHNTRLVPIENNISALMSKDIEHDTRFGNVERDFSDHISPTNTNAHDSLFRLKENTSNKIVSITESPSRDILYPSVGGVIDYVSQSIINALNDFNPDLDMEKLTTVKYVNDEIDVPTASNNLSGYIYFVENMTTFPGQNGMVAFVKNPSGIVEHLKIPISRNNYSNEFTIDPDTGELSLDINSSINNALENYITEETANNRFLRSNEITLSPGANNGEISITAKGSTKTAKVHGLSSLAFKESISNSDLDIMPAMTVKANTRDFESTPRNIPLSDLLTSSDVSYLNDDMEEVVNVKNALDYLSQQFSPTVGLYEVPTLTLQDENNSNWIYTDIMPSRVLTIPGFMQFGYTVKELKTKGTSSGNAFIYYIMAESSLGFVRVFNPTTGTKGSYRIYHDSSNSVAWLWKNDESGKVLMSELDLQVGDYYELIWFSAR